jgi:hypothetical protein
MKRLYENKLAELNERAKTAKQHDRSGILNLKSELDRSDFDCRNMTGQNLAGPNLTGVNFTGLNKVYTLQVRT